MTLNRILNSLPRFFREIKNKSLEYDSIKSASYFFYSFLIVLFFVIFIVVYNYINYKNKIETQNFNKVIESKEFSNLGNYFISKINSPYSEIKYLIEQNDSIEKILNKFQINANDIKIISSNLKQKKLTNIFSGKELSLVLKKLDDKTNSVVSLIYPINNTLSI